MGLGIWILWAMGKGLRVLMHHLRFEEFFGKRISLLDRERIKDICNIYE